MRATIARVLADLAEVVERGALGVVDEDLHGVLGAGVGGLVAPAEGELVRAGVVGHVGEGRSGGEQAEEARGANRDRARDDAKTSHGVVPFSKTDGRRLPPPRPPRVFGADVRAAWWGAGTTRAAEARGCRATRPARGGRTAAPGRADAAPRCRGEGPVCR